MHEHRCGNCKWAQEQGRGNLVCIANPPMPFPVSRQGRLANQVESGVLSCTPSVESERKGCRFWERASWAEVTNG